MTFISDIISLGTSYSFKYSSKIELLKEDWELVNSKNVYLSIAYLKALENSTIDNVSYIYTIVYQHKKPVGVVYFQWIHVKDDFFIQEKFPNKIKSQFVVKLLKKNNGGLLLCGNFFAAGNNGYYFSTNQISQQVLITLIDKITKLLCTVKNTPNIKMVLFKEFWIDKDKAVQHLLEKKTRRFQIDVNMVLALKENWNSFEDYLQTMTTKYRTKAKSVYKKTASLLVKELTADEILLYSDDISELFTSVLNTAGFNMLKLTTQSFYQFKNQLKDKFIFKAYFLEDKMIGFATSCLNNSYLDANYVGIDYSVNKQYPLYQRILFDYVKLAINEQVGELRLGRTAETIKSSLGAVPKEMNLYLKHTNPIVQFTLSPLLAYVKPSDFELRNPFKKEVYFHNV